MFSGTCPEIKGKRGQFVTLKKTAAQKPLKFLKKVLGKEQTHKSLEIGAALC